MRVTCTTVWLLSTLGLYSGLKTLQSPPREWKPARSRVHPHLTARDTVVQVGHEGTPSREGIACFDRQIAQAVAEHPDFAIFDSFPGAGPALAPRLLAAFGAQRARYQSAADLKMFSGIAPVTERSGKSEWVHVRWACPRFLRQTFHEWAAHSIGFCAWAAAYYRLQRDFCKDHHAAVRALAFKWIRIAFRCWQDGVLYDDARYVQSLRRRGSPLTALLDKPVAP